MSCWLSGSASFPSPLPPGPWQRSQCFLKSALPASTAFGSPANGFFSSAALGGSVHPPGRGASGFFSCAAVDPVDDVGAVAARALTARLATNTAPAVAKTHQRLLISQ